MADQKLITLYEGASPSTDIILRALPVADVPTTDIFLYAGESPSTDIVLRTVPGSASAPAGAPFRSDAIVVALPIRARTVAAAIVNQARYGAAVAVATRFPTEPIVATPAFPARRAQITIRLAASGGARKAGRATPMALRPLSRTLRPVGVVQGRRAGVWDALANARPLVVGGRPAFRPFVRPLVGWSTEPAQQAATTYAAFPVVARAARVLAQVQRVWIGTSPQPQQQAATVYAVFPTLAVPQGRRAVPSASVVGVPPWRKTGGHFRPTRFPLASGDYGRPQWIWSDFYTPTVEAPKPKTVRRPKAAAAPAVTALKPVTAFDGFDTTQQPVTKTAPWAFRAVQAGRLFEAFDALDALLDQADQRALERERVLAAERAQQAAQQRWEQMLVAAELAAIQQAEDDMQIILALLSAITDDGI